MTQLEGEVSSMTEFGELTGTVGMNRDEQKTIFFLPLLVLEVKHFYVMVDYFAFLFYESSSNRQVA